MKSKPPQPVKSVHIGFLKMDSLPKVVATHLHDTNGDGRFTEADTGGSKEKAIAELAKATTYFYDGHPLEVPIDAPLQAAFTNDSQPPNEQNTTQTFEIEMRFVLTDEMIEAGLNKIYSNLEQSLQLADQLLKSARSITGVKSKKKQIMSVQNWDRLFNTLIQMSVQLLELRTASNTTMRALEILDQQGVTREANGACCTYNSSKMYLSFLSPALQQLNANLNGISHLLSGVIFCKGENCDEKITMPKMKEDF